MPTSEDPPELTVYETQFAAGPALLLCDAASNPPVRQTNGVGARSADSVSSAGTASDTQEQAALGIVIVVDDKPLCRDATATALRGHGLEVAKYSSGRELLEQSLPDRPTAIVLDARMPGMDGFAVLQALRDRGVAAPVLLLTAYGDIPMAHRAGQRGVFAFLQKGVESPILYSRVVAALKEARSAMADQERTRALYQSFNALTSQQRAVFDLIAKDTPYKQIGAQLKISVGTVKTHRSRIAKRMGIPTKSNAELVRIFDLLTGRRHTPGSSEKP